MIIAPDDFNIELQNGNRNYQFDIRVYVKDEYNPEVDNLEYTFTNEDLWANGVSWNEACSNTNSFDIGGAIISSLDIKINNLGNRYASVDFDGATVVVFVTLNYINYEFDAQGNIVGEEVVSTSPVLKGQYIVDSSSTSGHVITLYCLDSLCLLDVPCEFDFVENWYPIQLAKKICDDHGIRYTRDIADENITKFPHAYKGGDMTMFPMSITASDNVTCREVLSDIAEMYGAYVYMTNTNLLDFGFYDDDASPISLEDGVSKYDASTKFVSISGAYATVESNGEEQTYVAGTMDYGFDLSSNLLLPYTFPTPYLHLIKDRYENLEIKPFNISHISDPRLMAGDRVTIYDRISDRSYSSIVTNTSFKAGAYQTSSCGAESNQLKGSQRFSQSAKATANLEKYINEKTDFYRDYLNNYAQLMSNGFGLYLSEREYPEGSGAKIFFMHNAMTYEDSTYALCFSSSGLLQFSRSSADDDWGDPVSVSASDGSAFYQRLFAERIDADFIKTHDLYVDIEHRAQFGQYAFVPRSDTSVMFLYVGDNTNG